MFACFHGATTLPYSLEQDIAAAARAGFTALEIWGDKLDRFLQGRSIPRLAEMLGGYGLEPAAIDEITLDLSSDEPLASARPLLVHYGQVAMGIGCDTVLLAVRGQPRGLSASQALNLLAKLMLPLCATAARYGLRLALEPRAGEPPVSGPQEALEAIEISRQANLGLSWDFFHSYKAGVSLETLRRIPANRLWLVHASDAPDKDPATLVDSGRIWPGRGVLPLNEYFAILREMRYGGPVSVLVPNPEYAVRDPEELAREAYESLEVFMPLRV